jgi:hypothetical protein
LPLCILGLFSFLMFTRAANSAVFNWTIVFVVTIANAQVFGRMARRSLQENFRQRIAELRPRDAAAQR